MNIEEFEQLKQQSIGHSLIKAARLYNEYALNFVRDEFGQASFKNSHLVLFPHIPFEGTTVNELSKNLKISKQAVSVLVNELLDMDVLVKSDNPKDKRSFIINFKGGSSSKLMKGMKGLAELDRELIELLGPETDHLKISLDKIIVKYQN